jgi:DNA-binding response OmpR family regulator
MQNILIIEEQVELTAKLKEMLSTIGYKHIDIVDRVEFAIDKIKDNLYDLIIFDINNKDSLKYFNQLDSEYIYDIPIVYLMSLGDIKNIDDLKDIVGFVLEPKRLDEFCDINTNSTENLYIELGNRYTYCLSKSQLLCDKVAIHLTKREKRLLELLIKTNNKIISTEEILYNIWDEKVVSDKTIRTLIKQLNDKFDFSFIQNVYGQGYKTDTIKTNAKTMELLS